MVKKREKRGVVIVDLDNCISDDKWRVPLICAEKDLHDPERYYKYHSKCGFDDAKNEWLWRGVDYDVIIFTSRPDDYRSETLEWLKANGVKHKGLYMRPAKNFAPCVELKRTFLRNAAYFYGRERILKCVDDRDDVLEMYAAEGYKTEKVCINEGYALDGATIENSVLGEWAQPEPPPLETIERALADAEKTDRAEKAVLKNAEKSVLDVVEGFKKTFESRTGTYGANYLDVAEFLRNVFPQGVPAETLHSPAFNLFILLLVKVSRFAHSKCLHLDSIHDAGVYCALIEKCLLDNATDRKETALALKENGIL